MMLNPPATQPGAQQHPPAFAGSARLPIGSSAWLPSFIAGVAAILFLISEAIVMKACSTLVALFADVSRKGTERDAANSCARAVRQDASTTHAAARQSAPLPCRAALGAWWPGRTYCRRAAYSHPRTRSCAQHASGVSPPASARARRQAAPLHTHRSIS